MQNAITRLALCQFVLVIYLTLGIAVEVKIFYTDQTPSPFVTHLRDYGFLLLSVPAGWLLAASIDAHRPRPNLGDGAGIFASGIGLLVGLAVMALVATIMVGAPATHLVQVISTPEPTSSLHVKSKPLVNPAVYEDQ